MIFLNEPENSFFFTKIVAIFQIPPLSVTCADVTAERTNTDKTASPYLGDSRVWRDVSVGSGAGILEACKM